MDLTGNNIINVSEEEEDQNEDQLPASQEENKECSQKYIFAERKIKCHTNAGRLTAISMIQLPSSDEED